MKQTKTASRKSKWPKLPVAFKRKWVRALRSGEFKQGSGTLHNASENSFCCLGVAARITGAKVESGRGFIPVTCTVVPRPLCGDGYLATALSTRNDAHSGYWTFPRIATWIEKNL